MLLQSASHCAAFIYWKTKWRCKCITLYNLCHFAIFLLKCQCNCILNYHLMSGQWDKQTFLIWLFAGTKSACRFRQRWNWMRASVCWPISSSTFPLRKKPCRNSVISTSQPVWVDDTAKGSRCREHKNSTKIMLWYDNTFFLLLDHASPSATCLNSETWLWHLEVI